MSYLFVFRAYPDIDHMAPLAWKLLEGGEEVHAIVSPGYDPAGDHHLTLLRAYERFHLTEVAPDRASGLARVAGVLRGTLPYAMAYVLRHRIRLVAVEWGYGLNPSFDRRGTLAWAKGVGRSLAGSLVRARARDPQQPRASFIVAGRVLRRPVVCLPHGLSVKLDAAFSPEITAQIERGEFDLTDRNRFDAYVLNTEHHRRLHMESGKGDGEVMQTWGSVRWSPEWFDVNRRLPPRYEWPAAGAGRVKVVFMVPKWKNKVDGPAVISLLRSLAASDRISVAVKGHPRPKDGSADPLRDDPTIDWTRLHDVDGVDSVSLIAAADVVLDVGSSIGLEVVMQEKVLVNPAYLHELTTLFDEIEGTCVVARSDEEVATYLAHHAAGERFSPDPDALAELLRRAVYAERPEPYDVLDLYQRNVRQLATSRS